MRIWPKLKKRDWYILLAFTLVYFALNLSKLTDLPIFVDESIYLRWAQIAWHDPSWRFISLTDGKQPLYIWFVIPFMKYIADPLVAGRVASVVAGYFTLLGSGYSAYLLKNKKLALIVMLFVLTSPYIFFYNRFAVMESLLTAYGVWILAISVLLAKYKRLDLTMILGFFLGFGMLVKSSALFFIILSPVAYLLYPNHKPLFSKQTIRYLLLILVACGIATLIYNVQRLSPWMSVISEKNASFTVPYREIFSHPDRLWSNSMKIINWHFAYSTIPISLLTLVGFYLLARTNLSLFIVLLLWVGVQLGGTVAIAKFYAPRYISFITPFILIVAAYGISIIKNSKQLFITTLLVLVLPTSLLIKLITDPFNYPYVKTDEGYVNGWSAGNGTKQIADWAVSRTNTTNKPMIIFTEGTFGILPHGLELYTDARAPALTIRGLYPITTIPPLETLESVTTNPETYLILNNTQTTGSQPGLELVSEYPKKDPAYSMRLYRVLPIEK
ncbi:MAG: glycosyltransferase family 39 protein [bacterium]